MKKNKSQKSYLKILLIVLVIVVLFDAGYFGWNYYQIKRQVKAPIKNQQEDQVQREASNDVINSLAYINNWEVYKNDQYGFEIQYPKGLVVKDLNAGSVIKNPSEIGFSSDGLKLFYSLIIIDKNQLRQMNNFLDNPESYVESSNDIIDSRLKDIVINGMEWKSYDYVGGSGEYLEPLHFILDKDSLIIEMIPTNMSYENVDKILSTFKFTK